MEIDLEEYSPEARLKRGFANHGYELSGRGVMTCFEFRKPGEALRFVVRGAEGGYWLFWIESTDYDILNSDVRDIAKYPGVGLRTFIGPPEEFWEAVAEIIAERAN